MELNELHDLRVLLGRPFVDVLAEVVSPLPPVLAELCIEAPGLSTAEALDRLGLALGLPVALPGPGDPDYGKYERARALRKLGEAGENPFRILFKE